MADALARSWRVLRDGFRQVNDRLGILIVFSAFWYVIGFLPAFFFFNVVLTLEKPNIPAYLMIIGWTLLVLGPATASVYELTWRMLQRDDPTFVDFFRAFRQHYRRGVAITAVALAILVVLVIDIIFFYNLRLTWLRLLVIPWSYFILFWAMAANYLFPLLVQQGVGLRKLLQRSALLALDNALVSLMLVVLVVLFWLVGMFLQHLPLLLFFMGTVAMLHNVALEILLEKYRDRPAPEAEGAEAVGNGPPAP